MRDRLLPLALAALCFGTTGSYAAGETAAPQATGPFATKANVEVKAEDKVIPLKREEQIAFIFVAAINSLLDDCSRHAAEPCSLEALVRGPKPKDDWGMGRLEFDPNATDPNYTYTLTVNGREWEVWASPRKPGFGGFYTKKAFGGGTYYNAKGPATQTSVKLTETSIDRDLFIARQEGPTAAPLTQESYLNSLGANSIK
jgi:hypothetical protein